jgi:hypothetical protein
MSGTTKKPASSGSKEIHWETVLLELKTHIDSDRSAENALKVLVARGGEERKILQSLFLFCGGNPHAMRMLREELNFVRTRKISPVDRDVRPSTTTV